MREKLIEITDSMIFKANLERSRRGGYKDKKKGNIDPLDKVNVEEILTYGKLVHVLSNGLKVFHYPHKKKDPYLRSHNIYWILES